MTIKPLLFLVTVSVRKALGIFLAEIFAFGPKVPRLARAMSAGISKPLGRIEGFFALNFRLSAMIFFAGGRQSMLLRHDPGGVTLSGKASIADGVANKAKGAVSVKSANQSTSSLSDSLLR